MNIAILGFGLMGRLCALQLRKSARLTVFSADEADRSESAGAVAAAMMAPLSEAVHCNDSQLLNLGRESLAMWPQILADLSDPVWFQQAGTMVVCHHNDKALLSEFQQRLTQLQQDCAILPAAQLRDIESSLPENFQQGLWLEGEGQLDNKAFYRASLRACQQADVDFFWQTEIDSHSGSRWAAEWTQGRIAGQQFDAVLDCRGLGARQTLAIVPGKEGLLRAVRGEIIRVIAPDVQFTRPVRFMHPKYPLYVAPKPNNEYVIGATEIESQDESAISLRSTMELLSAAYALHPGFAEARIRSAQVGLRPAFQHHHPEIYNYGRYYSVNGLYRHGYLIGALFSQAVVNLIQGKTIPNSVTQFIRRSDENPF